MSNSASKMYAALAAGRPAAAAAMARPAARGEAGYESA